MTCKHDYLIKTHGKRVRGVCKLCGKVRYFTNHAGSGFQRKSFRVPAQARKEADEILRQAIEETK